MCSGGLNSGSFKANWLGHSPPCNGVELVDTARGVSWHKSP